MRMRVLLLLTGMVVFAAMLIIDPVALVHLGYACATGGCGVRPVWLAAGAGAVAALWAVLALRRPRPVARPAGRSSTRKRQARRRPTSSGKQGKPAPVQRKRKN